MHTRTQTHTHRGTQTQEHAPVHTRTQTHTQRNTQTQEHAPVHTRTQTHTQRNTHTHTTAQIPTQGHTSAGRFPPSPGTPYLPAPAGQARVAPDLALQVVLALAMPAQVDGAGLHVDVHQVVHDAALDVVLHAVHQEAPAHIDHLNQRQVPAGGASPSDTAGAAGAATQTRPPPHHSLSCRGHRPLCPESRGSEPAIPRAEWG